MDTDNLPFGTINDIDINELYTEYGKKVFELNLAYSNIELLRSQIAIIEEKLSLSNQNNN